MVRSLGTPLAVAEVKAPARTRVLVVANLTADPGGYANEAEALATRLLQAGDVVITTSYQSLLSLRVADMILTSLLVKNRVDVALVDVRAGAPFRWARWVTTVLRGARVPVVHVLRGENLAAYARANGARFSRLLGDSSAVIAVSGYQYEELSTYGEIAEVIPQPIDAGAYPFRVRAGAAPKLACMASASGECDAQLCLRVLAELSTRLAADAAPTALRPQLTLMFEDLDGGGRQELLASAQSLGVEKQVVLHGRVTRAEAPAQLAAADVYLNTSDDDVAPHGVTAALACGLCVVSTAGGGMAYQLRDQVDALLVPHGDSAAMVDAVERVVEDPALAERLSRNARAKAESHDWSQVLPKWRAVLHKVAARTGGGP